MNLPVVRRCPQRLLGLHAPNIMPAKAFIVPTVKFMAACPAAQTAICFQVVFAVVGQDTLLLTLACACQCVVPSTHIRQHQMLDWY